MERFDSSGIRPPALQYLPRERAIRDIGIVDVGNFKLATARWFKGLDDVEYARIIKIHTSDRIGRSGIRRLFFNLYDAIPLKNRHPEPLGVLDLLQEDFRPLPLR